MSSPTGDYKRVWVVEQNAYIVFYSIRALFGTDGSHNATHGSDSQASAKREIALIFENDESHVVEVQALADGFDTQDVCKPDAVDESKEQLPEVAKEPATTVTTAKVDGLDTKNVTVDHEANEVEPTVDTKHLHTADLVTSQDNVTDLSQKEGGETIYVAPGDIKKDETEEARVVADDTEEKEAAVADPVVVSLDAKLNASIEDTDATDNLAAATTDNKKDDALEEEKVVQVVIADVKVDIIDDSTLDTKEAPGTQAPNAKETPVTSDVNDKQVPQVDAIVSVTVEATTTDTNDVNPDTTNSAKEADTAIVVDNTKEDTHVEENKNIEQIKAEPVKEKQDVKMEPENVVIEAEVVAANVDIVENGAEIKANTEAPQELEAVVHVKEAKIGAVLEPAVTVPVAMETPKAESTVVSEEAKEEKEPFNTEQDKKQEEPVAVAIHADITTANVQDNDDDTGHHHQQHGVTSDVVTSQEDETQQTHVIVIANNDTDAEKLLDAPKEKNVTEDHQDVKLSESVTQEKEVRDISHLNNACNITMDSCVSCLSSRAIPSQPLLLQLRLPPLLPLTQMPIPHPTAIAVIHPRILV